jgi:hypothetical protein
VTIGAGQAATLDIQATPGVYLEVTINDPQRRLPTTQNGPLDFPQLIVGVCFGSGAFPAAQRKSIGAGAAGNLLAAGASSAFTINVPGAVPSTAQMGQQ